MRDQHTIRFRGLMLEKFLDKALDEGVRLYSVSRAGKREALLSADEKGCEKLLALAEKYRLDVTVVRVGKRTALLKGMRGRIALLVSLVVCAAALFAASQRIWVIEAPEDIKGALKTLGIEQGVFRDDIDTRLTETRLLSMTKEYSFIGVRARGIVLTVETVPQEDEPEIYDVLEARDLVASRDGVVVSVNVRTGEAAVKPGDTVKRGQLLIRGEEQKTDESTRGVRALGEVMARVWVSGEAEATLYETVSERTGRVASESEVTLWEFKWPLKTAEAFGSESTQEEYLPIGGLFLPLMIRRVIHFETVEMKRALDEEQVREETARLAMDGAEAILPNPCEMIDKWVDYSMIERDLVRARATIECRVDIAVSREALSTGGS